jgi:phosphoribosylamine--glycine ligase
MMTAAGPKVLEFNVRLSGRVLGVTAAGQDLPGAIDGAYQAVRRIAFDGMHYREDIGRKGMMWPIGGFQCEYRQLL